MKSTQFWTGLKEFPRKRKFVLLLVLSLYQLAIFTVLTKPMALNYEPIPVDVFLSVFAVILVLDIFLSLYLLFIAANASIPKDEDQATKNYMDRWFCEPWVVWIVTFIAFGVLSWMPVLGLRIIGEFGFISQGVSICAVYFKHDKGKESGIKAKGNSHPVSFV